MGIVKNFDGVIAEENRIDHGESGTSGLLG
jgi:hypothetical protein